MADFPNFGNVPVDEQGIIDYDQTFGFNQIPTDENGIINFDALKQRFTQPQQQQPQQQQPKFQSRDEMEAYIKTRSHLTKRYVDEILKDSEISAAPWAKKLDGSYELLPPASGTGGSFWNPKTKLLSKEDPKGTGFTNWFSDVAGEVAGYEPTWGRTVDPETGKAKIISDEDINKMLTDIADRNVNSPLSHYQIDPQEFKETLRVGALAKASVDWYRAGVDWSERDKDNLAKIAGNLSNRELSQYVNTMDRMAEDGSIDRSSWDVFRDALVRGTFQTARAGEGIATLIGSKTDERLEQEELESQIKALQDQKVRQAEGLEKPAEFIGEMAVPMATSAVLGASATALTKSPAIGAAVTSGFWFDQTVGDLKDDLRRAGLNDTEASLYAAPAAAAIAAVELLQIKGLGKASKPVQKAIIAGLGKSTDPLKKRLLKGAIDAARGAGKFGVKAGLKGVEESTEEAIQQAMELGTKFLANKMHDAEFDFDQEWDNVKSSFTESLIPMTILGGAFGSVGKYREYKGVNGLRAKVKATEIVVDEYIDNQIKTVGKSPKDFDRLINLIQDPLADITNIADLIHDPDPNRRIPGFSPRDLKTFLGSKARERIVTAVQKNMGEITAGRQEAVQRLQEAIAAQQLTDEQKNDARGVANVFKKYYESNPQMADKIADFVSAGDFSRSAFKKFGILDGKTYRKDGSLNTDTDSGKLIAELLRHNDMKMQRDVPTFTQKSTGQQVAMTPDVLMRINAGDFNQWVGEQSGVPGQYIPEKPDQHDRVKKSPQKIREQLINQYLPEAKFVIPENLFKIGNQSTGQRRAFNEAMQESLTEWGVAKEEKDGIRQYREMLKQEQAEAGNVIGGLVGELQEVHHPEAEVKVQPMPVKDLELMVNTVGSMLDKQGMIEDKAVVNELIEKAVDGDVASQKELLGMMSQLSEGKTVAFEEQNWEPVPSQMAEAEKLGTNFNRLVEMGYLEDFSVLDDSDIAGFGLDPEATFLAGIEVNKRRASGEEVDFNELANIIYEKHTGRVMDFQQQGAEVSPEKEVKTVPRGKQPKGQFVYSELGEPAATFSQRIANKKLGLGLPVKAAKKGDPVVTPEQPEVREDKTPAAPSSRVPTAQQIEDWQRASKNFGIPIKQLAETEGFTGEEVSKAMEEKSPETLAPYDSSNIVKRVSEVIEKLEEGNVNKQKTKSIRSLLDTFANYKKLRDKEQAAAKRGDNKSLISLVDQTDAEYKNLKKQINQRIKKAKEKGNVEEQKYWEDVRDGNIDPLMELPPILEEKKKTPLAQKSELLKEHQDDLASDLGEQATDFMDELNKITTDPTVIAAASEFRLLADPNRSAKENLNTILNKLKELGIPLKVVDGEMVYDPTSIEAAEAQESIIGAEEEVPHSGNSKWWSDLTMEEREQHVRQGFALVNEKLSRAGLPLINESDVDFHKAIQSDFPGGVIGATVDAAPKATGESLVTPDMLLYEVINTSTTRFVDVLERGPVPSSQYRAWARRGVSRYSKELQETGGKNYAFSINPRGSESALSQVGYPGEDATNRSNSMLHTFVLDHSKAKKLDISPAKIIKQMEFKNDWREFWDKESRTTQAVKERSATPIIDGVTDIETPSVIPNELAQEIANAILEKDTLVDIVYDSKGLSSNLDVMIQISDLLPKEQQWKTTFTTQNDKEFASRSSDQKVSFLPIEASKGNSRRVKVFDIRDVVKETTEIKKPSPKKTGGITELYFTLDGGKDFGAFVPQRIEASEMSEDGSKMASAAVMLPAEWADKWGLDKSEHKKLIMEFFDKDMADFVSDRVRTYYSPETSTTNTYVPPQPLTKKELLLLSKKHTKDLDEMVVDIAERLPAGTFNWADVPASLIEEWTATLKDIYPEAKHIEDIAHTYLLDRLPTQMESMNQVQVHEEWGEIPEGYYKDGRYWRTGSDLAVHPFKPETVGGKPNNAVYWLIRTHGMSQSDAYWDLEDSTLGVKESYEASLPETKAELEEMIRDGSYFERTNTKPKKSDIGEQKETAKAPPVWEMPLDVDIDGRQEMGSMNTFTDREGKKRDLAEFGGEDQRATKGKIDYSKLPVGDMKLDVEKIEELAPGLKHVKSDESTGTHTFRAKDGEDLVIRTVKYIPFDPEAGMEGYSDADVERSVKEFEKTGVSPIQGLHVSSPGKQKPHQIFISDYGLSYDNRADGGAELEEIVHWTQLSGRWSPEINDFLQKEFSKQSVESGKSQADVIEDTAKGFAEALVRAKKYRNPKDLGRVRKVIKKLMDSFNDWLISSGWKGMDVDYVIGKWLKGDIVGGKESLVRQKGVMQRQYTWAGKKVLTDEQIEEAKAYARTIPGMFEGADPQQMGKAAEDMATAVAESDKMAALGRAGRTKRIISDVVKGEYTEPFKSGAEGTWTSVKDWVRVNFTESGVKGKKQRRKMTQLNEQRRGFIEHYVRKTTRTLRDIEDVKKNVFRLKEFPEQVQQSLFMALKDPDARENLADNLSAHISDEKRATEVFEGFLEVSNSIQELRDTIDELTRLAIEEDLVDGALEVVLNENLEVYVNRAYELFEDPVGWKDYLDSPKGKKLKDDAAKQLRRDVHKKISNKLRESIFKAWKKGRKPKGMKGLSYPETRIKAELRIKAEISAGVHDEALKAMDSNLLIDRLLIDVWENAMALKENADIIKNRAVEKLQKQYPYEEATRDVDLYLQEQTSGSSGRRAEFGPFLERKNISEAMRALYGEIKTLRGAGITIEKVAGAIAKHKFNRSIVESALFDNFIRKKKPETGGFELLKGREYGHLDGLYVAPVFKKAMESGLGNSSNLTKWIQGDNISSFLLYSMVSMSSTTKAMKTVMGPRTASRNAWEELIWSWVNGWWSPSFLTLKKHDRATNRAAITKALAIAEHTSDVRGNRFVKTAAAPGLALIKRLFGKGKNKRWDITKEQDFSEAYDGQLDEIISKLGITQNSLQSLWHKHVKIGDGPSHLEMITTPNSEKYEIDPTVRSRSVWNFLRKGLSFGNRSAAVQAAGRQYQESSDVSKVMGFLKERAHLQNAMRYKLGEQGLSDSAIEEKVRDSAKEIDEEAADKVNNLTPTISRIAPIIKDLSAFPFIGNFPVWFTGYMKSNMGIYKIALGEMASDNAYTQWVGAKRMLRGLFVHVALGALARSAYLMFGFDDEDEEAIRSSVHPFQRNHTLIPIPTEDGFEVFDASQTFPWLMPMDFLLTSKNEGVKEAADEIISSYVDEDIFSSTLMDMFVRDGENKFGYKVWDSLDDPTAKVIKGIDYATFGFLNKGRGPLTPGFIQEAKRTYEAAAGEETATGVKRSKGWQASRVVMGSEVVQYVPERQLSLKAKEFRDGREAHTRSVRKYGYGKNSSKFRESLERFEVLNAGLYKEMELAIRAARLGGMTDAEIVRSLEQSNIPKIDIRHFLAGKARDITISSKSLRGMRSSGGQENIDAYIKYKRGDRGE